MRKESVNWKKRFKIWNSAVTKNMQKLPPIVIEQFHVERIVVDKVEYTNNFGSLGIKELSGMLNIGANYGIGTAPKDKEKKDQNTQPRVKEGKEEKKKKQSHQGSGPKLTINYKKTPGGKQVDKNGKNK
ncbi:hypothetical protein SAMN05660706_11267 [Desulfoscipio geothermicus DSM 3669]|uniref:Uncharacterized protein n=1 Tax=Desulfoscipio geothermicus DSM 3669 TaxID=1121426 RepID=A0A1I6DJK9_9FIRM|nr:hypothetical protein SAMN05660706_11267 [Desulfoscipio geothermicus DSM 3669]